MSLRLSQHDQSLVAAATRALVSPVVAPSFEDWLREVNRTLKELLWADKASFMFPVGGEAPRAVSDELSSPMLQSWMREKIPDLDRRWGFRRRCVELGAFNRQLVFGAHLPVFYRSDYYHEYLVPHRAFDGLGLATAVDTPSRMVTVQLHHDRPTGRRFGARGMGLVRMLFPAFKAGVHAARTLFLERQRLTQMLDAMTAGVALADASGRVIHKNRALVHVLGTNARGAELDAAVATAARSAIAVLCGSVIDCDGSSASSPRALRRRVSIGEATYTLSAALLCAGPGPTEAAVAVLVECARPDAFPSAELQHRYRLTPRELEVVRLLGHGASNDEIARTLEISPATARHHTESAMLKIGVNARARIPALLASLTAREE